MSNSKNRPVNKKVEEHKQSVTNKTNQKQVVEILGNTYNIPPLGTISVEGSYRSVAEAIDFWKRKEILTITKNQ